MPDVDELRSALQDALAGPALDDVAFAMDQVRNNTSLVTLMVFGNRRLLFPGDAQYGNWLWWLQNRHGYDILKQVDFLKISHHGSINASPRDVVDHLTGDLAAMVSTQTVPWESIPRLPLLDALGLHTRGRIVRSDQIQMTGAPNAPALQALPAGFTQGDFWFDYTIPL